MHHISLFAVAVLSSAVLALPFPLGGVAENPSAYALAVAKEHTPTAQFGGKNLMNGNLARAYGERYGYPPRARAHTTYDEEPVRNINAHAGTNSAAHSTPLERAPADGHRYPYRRPYRTDLPDSGLKGREAKPVAAGGEYMRDREATTDL